MDRITERIAELESEFLENREAIRAERRNGNWPEVDRLNERQRSINDEINGLIGGEVNDLPELIKETGK